MSDTSESTSYFTPTFSFTRGEKPERVGVYCVLVHMLDLQDLDSDILTTRWLWSYWNGKWWGPTAGNKWDAAKNASQEDTFPTRRRLIGWFGLTHRGYEIEAQIIRDQMKP